MAIFHALDNATELVEQTMLTVILRRGDSRLYQRFVIPATGSFVRATPLVVRATTIADLMVLANAVADLSAAVLQSVTMSIYHAEDNSLVIPDDTGAFEYQAKLLVASENNATFQIRVMGLAAACDPCDWFAANRDALILPDGFLAREIVQIQSQRQRASRSNT
jgi:hypothetical protein